MRNRAKCKKCESTIESYGLSDTIECDCGAIAISGGDQKFMAFATDWSNFLRIDEDGNIIEVKIVDPTTKPLDSGSKLVDDSIHRPTKAELLQQLASMTESYGRLPQHAMMNPINGYDICSLMLLLQAIFESEK